MNSKLIDALYGIVIQFKWKYMFILLITLYCGSWQIMRIIEPQNEMVKAKAYWWYYLNDVIRSGNSGYQPASIGGRMVATLCSAAGSICFFAIVCKTIGQTYTLTQKRKKGKAKVNEKKHIILLGYRQGETEMLIKQLRSGKFGRTKVVLCSRKFQENPFPESVDFVCGDNAMKETLNLANIDDAAAIVISGHTDERTIMIGILANQLASANCHIVAYFDEEMKAEILRSVAPRIECVTSLRPVLLAQTVLHPGTFRLFKDLANFEHSTCCSIAVPARIKVPVNFGSLFDALRERHGAILIGFSCGEKGGNPTLNPSNGTQIKGGMTIYLVVDHDIEDEIQWETIK